MNHWFSDTNILIDFLLNRPPFAADAATLLNLAERGEVNLHAASLSFATAYYLGRKTRSHEQTLVILSSLQQLVEVVAVDATTARQALVSGFTDFEDALQYHAATAVPAIEAIITRDPKGFQASALSVMTPAEALRRLA